MTAKATTRWPAGFSARSKTSRDARPEASSTAPTSSGRSRTSWDGWRTEPTSPRGTCGTSWTGGSTCWTAIWTAATLGGGGRAGTNVRSGQREEEDDGRDTSNVELELEEGGGGGCPGAIRLVYRSREGILEEGASERTEAAAEVAGEEDVGNDAEDAAADDDEAFVGYLKVKPTSVGSYPSVAVTFLVAMAIVRTALCLSNGRRGKFPPTRAMGQRQRQLAMPMPSLHPRGRHHHGYVHPIMPHRIICHRLHSTSDEGGDSGDGDGSSSLWYSPSLMDHMLHRIKAVNHTPYDVQQGILDFSVSGRVLGKVTPKVAERLSSTGGPIFELSTGTNRPTLTLGNAAGTTVEQRTRSVKSVMERLRDEGYVTGWRDELYPVAESFGDPPAFLIERAAASLLGVMEYGVHINGLVRDEHGETRMWMARRSKTKSKFPGFLDHIVAGGQPAGLSLMDNVIKECTEEAGIPPELTRQGIKAAGAISYENYGGPRKDRGEGVMSRVVLFCFDLLLPKDFVPTANDGEVENFFTWGLEDIGRSMAPEYDDPIKPNCYPVIIDYMLRSGAISPDSPKYLEILRTLRSGTCS
ncbi:hypothetical protein ACHAWF_017171 [Thalassiosira exigua]